MMSIVVYICLFIYFSAGADRPTRSSVGGVLLLGLGSDHRQTSH